ncbi:MAG: SpoIID/LytB domain-containing protein [Candidatus Omnitrophota bacterium]
MENFTFPMVNLPKIKKSSIILMLAICYLLFARTVFAEGDMIRVAILRDGKSMRLDVRGKYDVFSGNNILIKTANNLRRAYVNAISDGIKIANISYKFPTIIIRPQKDGNIYVNNRRFKGELIISKTGNEKLLAVNKLSIEDYLRGVLYHEISHRWPMEAIKAQAIAARTYALYVAKNNKAKPYDLTCDIYSQMYGGATSERRKLNRAIDQTSGLVLKYKNELLPAFYHSTCGGHTEDASQLWNVNITPLKGVPCEYCKGSRHYNWHAEISLWDLRKKLSDYGIKLGTIISIQVKEKNVSGRVTKLTITTDSGVTEVATKDFRLAVDPKVIRSTNFDINVRDGKAAIKGLGWGHGVGLCQWGALAMAKQGKTAQEILQYYYPGAEIANGPPVGEADK